MNITRKRPSKHERLLKALLKCVVVMTDNGQVFVSMGRPRLTEKQANQLVAIKQAMEKKGAKV
jgi:exosome complex RNA-binding protein Rrp4